MNRGKDIEQVDHPLFTIVLEANNLLRLENQGREDN